MRHTRTRTVGARQRLVGLMAAVVILVSGLIGNPPPVLAQEEKVDTGATPVGTVTSPILFQPATPVDVNATDGALPITDDPTVGSGRVPQAAAPPPDVATEIPAKRDEHSRTIANPDGSYSVESTAGRMNYLDASGTWQPIDLSLVAAQGVPPGSPYALAVKSFDREVLFGESDPATGLAFLKGDGHAISLRAIGYGAAKERAPDENTLIFASDGTEGSVFVRPADTGFEFGAVIDGPLQSPAYHFALDTGDLVAQLAPDGQTIWLSDPALIGDGAPEKAVVGVISAPVLVGPDGSPAEPKVTTVVVSNRATPNLAPGVPAEQVAALGDTEVLVSYLIDAPWLADPAREFPVTLDPTACIGAGASGCTINGGATSDDEFIFSYNPDAYALGWTVTRAGYDNRTSDGGIYNAMRPLFYFPDVTLPDGAQITAATTTLKVSAVYGSPGGKQMQFYRVNVPWGTNSVVWNDIVPNGFDSASASPLYTIPSGVAAGDTLTIGMRNIAHHWYTRNAKDWRFDTGTMLRFTSETSTSGELTFKKYNDSTAANRPLLTLTYVLPALQLDFDAALGPTYAPSSMTAGQDSKVPVTIKNTTNTAGSPVTAYTFNKCTSGSDTDCYQLGYRWFDVKGNLVSCPSGYCTMDLLANIAAGATSAVHGLVVQAPATIGQYTLRLDLVHRLGGSGSTYLWSSDWAAPTKFYSRDKRISGSDSTRWTGSSVIERDDFSINVSTGGGTNQGVVKTVGTGDGGSLGINLATKNLRYAGDTGLGFADLGASLGLSYGYNLANVTDCTGILKACGWYTNWDERFVAAAPQNYDYTYQAPDGNRYLGSTDATGQIITGAPVQLSRPRFTWYDENPLAASAGATAVVQSASGAGIPTFSGPNVLRANSATSVSFGTVHGIDLEAYPLVSFAVRSNGASGAGAAFKIRNRTTGYEFWFVYTVGTNFTSGFDQLNIAGSVVNTWKSVVQRNLYNDVYNLHGDSGDDYEVFAFNYVTNGAASGYTWFDAVRFEGRTDAETGANANFFHDNNPAWSSGSGLASLITSDKAVGASSLQVGPAALASSPLCDSGASCWGSWNIDTNFPILTWHWKKSGGASIAVQLKMKDLRTNVIKQLTYYAGSQPATGIDMLCGPAGNAACAIRVDDQLPEEWTKVTRNVLADARQVLGFFNDNPMGSDPSAPPSQGPVGDGVRWIGYRVSAIDGQYARFDDLTSLSAADLDLDDPAGSQYGATAGDDFAARYADGSAHYFNADGLLTRISDRDGNTTRLDWTLNTSADPGDGQKAYELTTIRASTDGTTNSTYTYERQIDVTYATDNPITGLTKTTFAEYLGSTGTGGSTPTGRKASFVVATVTGSGSPAYGVGDLVYVSPARRTDAPCNPNPSRPTGCTEFSYSTTADHYLVQARDPRWDGSTGTASEFIFSVSYSGLTPIAIADRSHSANALLYVASFDRGGSIFRVPVFQTASMRAASFGTDVQLSPDGSTLTEYVAKACNGGQCAYGGILPVAAGASEKRVAYAFDGLSRINQVTTYRTASANAVVTRQATKAGIKIDNFADALGGNEVAWTQSPNQYAAWVDAGSPVVSGSSTPTSGFITSYVYDDHHRVSHTVTPFVARNNPPVTVVRDVKTAYDAEGHPISTDDATWIKNPGFELGLTGGWSTYTGTAVLDTSTFHSGLQSVKLNNSTTGTDHYQSITLVPGQTFRLQGWAKAGSGTTARISVIYRRASDLLYYTVGTLSTTSTSWTQLAGDFTIPTDGTGNIHVDLLAYANTTSWFDDISLFTTWSTTTFAANGLPTGVYTLDSAAASGSLRRQLSYAADNTHPAIFPTKLISNYGNGVPGPNPDDDVTSLSTFDRWGRVLTTTDADGVDSETTYAANKTDVAATADGLGNDTTYSYDLVGNRLTTTSPLGELTSVTYDQLNHPLVTTSADRTEHLDKYDNFGQRTSAVENYENDSPSSSLGIDDVTTSFSYDAYGQVTQTVGDTGFTGGLNATSASTFDLMGHVVQATAYTGDRLPNGGFEAATTLRKWSINAAWSLRTDGNTTYVHSGSNSLQAVVPNPSVTSYGNTDRLSMTSGNRYAATAWVNGYYTNSASANITMKVRFFKADNTYSDLTVGSTVTKGTSQTWTQIAGTVTAPVGTVDGYVLLSLGATTVGDRIYIDDVTLDELRTTTSYFDAAGNPTGSQGPIESGSGGGRAPACPGAAGEYCNSVATVDRNGRTTSVATINPKTGATAPVNSLTDYDFAGHAVRSIANYGDDVYNGGAPGGAPDEDIITTTTYDILGRQTSVTDVLGRTTTTAYDKLDRATITTRADGSFSKTAYLPSGRVDRTSRIAASGTTDANLSWTKSEYDAAGRQVRTIDHWDYNLYARTKIATFEDRSTSGWSTAGDFFVTAGASLNTDDDWHVTAPSSGRGRLRVFTSGGTTNTGAWWDLSGRTFQSGRAYKIRFDLIGWSGYSLRAFFGQDASGGSYQELSGGITTDGQWHTYEITWTPSAPITTDVHFAVRKDLALSIQFFLDNVVVFDTAYPDFDVPTETAYDDDGRVIASAVAPTNPASDPPLITTTAYDPAGRPISVSVNARHMYPGSVKNTATISAYWPFEELGGTTATDRQGSNPATLSGGYRLGIAGGPDEARTAVAFDGASGHATSNAALMTTGYTIEAWVKVAVAGQTNKGIAGRYVSNPSPSGAMLYLNGSSGAISFTHNGTSISSGVVPKAGQWYHAVGTWDGATAKIYVNNGTPSTVTATGATGSGSTSFEIGSYANGGSATFLNGAIDDVAIYTSALSATTVGSHYTAGRRTGAADGLTTRTDIDPLGRSTGSIDPRGIRTEFGYNRLGQLTSTTRNYLDGNSSGTTADDDVKSTFAYDDLGELLGYCPSIAGSTCNAAPAAWSTAAWHRDYDAAGHEVASVAPTGSTNLASAFVVYGASGLVTSRCNASQACASSPSRHTDYSYDALGRTLTQNVYQGAGTGTLKLAWTNSYFGDGSLKKVEFDGTPSGQADDTLDFTYDSLGRPDKVQRSGVDLTDNTWNVDDTLASRADGSLGTSTFSYDWADRLATATSPAATGTVSTTYGLDGLVKSKTLGNAETATLAYDAAKRPITITLATGGTLSQTYDRDGNVLTEGRTLTGISGNAGTGNHYFTYDGLNRVVQANLGSQGTLCGNAGATCYAYDRDGNRVTKQVGTTTTSYVYAATDQLVSQTIGVTTRSFTYDSYGNLTQSADAASATTTYTYDLGDRRTTLTPPVGTAANYGYDALGRVTSRSVGAVTDSYSFVGSTEVVWQIANASSTTNAAIDATNSRTAFSVGATTRYALFDLHGSLVGAENASKVITDAYRFDAYGELVAQVPSSGAPASPWRYQGHLDLSPDSANPVYENGARDYSPGLGVFLSLDSYTGQATDPLSMNRFLYAEGNPATFIDPTGHSSHRSQPDGGGGHGAYVPPVNSSGRPDDRVTGGADVPSSGSGGAAIPFWKADRWFADPDFYSADLEAARWAAFKALLCEIQSASRGYCFSEIQSLTPRQLASIGAQMWPGPGDAYQLTIAITGYDPIAGESLSPEDRVIGAGLTVLTLGAVPVTRLTDLERFLESSTTIRYLDPKVDGVYALMREPTRFPGAREYQSRVTGVPLPNYAGLGDEVWVFAYGGKKWDALLPGKSLRNAGTDVLVDAKHGWDTFLTKGGPGDRFPDFLNAKLDKELAGDLQSSKGLVPIEIWSSNPAAAAAWEHAIVSRQLEAFFDVVVVP